MGKFRDQMEADLEIRGLSQHTRKAYLLAVRSFVRHFMRPPDELAQEDIRQYQVHLAHEKRLSWSSFNVAVSAIKFFYKITLKKNWDFDRVPYQKTGRRLPVILSPQEVATLFSVTANQKHRALFMTLYAGGLRLSEVINLQLSDIDSQRMVIRIHQGKGRKDRYVMLSIYLLDVLREYWKAYRPQDWLFPNRSGRARLTARTVQKALKKAAAATAIKKDVTPHILRHAYATHLLENGTNIRVIQMLLGHRSLRSTEIYTHVAKTYFQDTQSPLDMLAPSKTSPASQA